MPFRMAASLHLLSPSCICFLLPVAQPTFFPEFLAHIGVRDHKVHGIVWGRPETRGFRCQTPPCRSSPRIAGCNSPSSSRMKAIRRKSLILPSNLWRSSIEQDQTPPRSGTIAKLPKDLNAWPTQIQLPPGHVSPENRFLFAA